MQALRRTLLAIVALGLLHVGALLADGPLHPARNADVAIVLGNTVNPDGTLSPRLEARMLAALELYERNWVRYILVTGATGEEGLNEAEVMQSWLLAKGVAPSAILVDRDGTNTRESAVHAAVLVRRANAKTAVVVTSYYHLARARLAAEAAGVDVVGTKPATLIWESREVYAIGREIVALYQYALDGWV